MIMGKLVKGLLVIALILGIGAFFIESKTEGFQALTDNFLSDKEVKEYYVKTSSGDKKGKDYLYTFEGYDEDGNQQTVNKISGSQIKVRSILVKSMQKVYKESAGVKYQKTKCLRKHCKKSIYNG